MNYDEFMSMIPEVTREYVNKSLRILSNTIIEGTKTYYIDRYGENIETFDGIQKKVTYIVNKNHKIFSWLISGLKSSNSDILNKIDYKNKLLWYDVNNKNINYSKSFEYFKDIFLIYEDDNYYYGLTPLEIVNNFYTNNSILFEPKFFTMKKFEELQSDLVLDNIIKNERDNFEKKLYKEVFKDLPISVIEYIETAAYIRNSSLFKNKYNCGTDEDKTALSLLFAHEACQDGKLLDMLKIEREGFKKDYAQDTVYSIKKDYVKYFEKGVCLNNNKKDITVEDILTNLLDRNVTNSLIIEKYINNAGLSKEDVLISFENEENLKKKINSVYVELPKDTVKSIEFTTKTYKLILKKLENNEYNKKIITNKKDIEQLSFYVSSYYNDGIINKFFDSYDVTYDKIMNLLNLNITKEEIEETEIDYHTLELFSKYFKDYKNIFYFDEILMVGCSDEYNDSTCLTDIFNEITSKYYINGKLDKCIYKYQKDNYERKLNNIYNGLSIEVIEFLEKVSLCEYYLYRKGFPEGERTIISFLNTILNIENNNLTKFLKEENIKKLIKDENGYIKESLSYKSIPNIDILKGYSKFIYEGANKNVDRNKILIYGIIKNIFNKDLYDKLSVKKYIDSFSKILDNVITYDNFDSKYYEYKCDIILGKYYENRKSDYNPNYQYLKNASLIHKRIKELNPSMKELEIEKLALSLALFTIDEYADCYPLKIDKEYIQGPFIRNRLSKENIISYLELKDIDLINFDEEIDYKIMFNNYIKYLCNDIENKTPYEYNEFDTIIDYRIYHVVLKLISNEVNDSNILENICKHYNGNYNILKEEIITKKRHEYTLSESIAMLNNEKIDELNLENVSSVLSFGNSLSEHSKNIHNQIPKLMLEDTTDESIKSINSILERTYISKQEQPKKRSLLERIFYVENEQVESKMVINTDAVEELKTAINNNIKLLSKELLGYDGIRKYVEAYLHKNSSFYKIANGAVNTLEEKLKSFNEEDDLMYGEFLSISSQLQIMREKEKRFATSSQLMRQELIKVNQAIVNHFITINALEMARDDLIPLIGTEVALTYGRETENTSLEISKNVIELFQSILTRNVDSAEENMRKLKETSISSELFNLINKDITTYIGELEQTTQFKELPKPDVKKLTLEK